MNFKYDYINERKYKVKNDIFLTVNFKSLSQCFQKGYDELCFKVYHNLS